MIAPPTTSTSVFPARADVSAESSKSRQKVSDWTLRVGFIGREFTVASRAT